MQLDAIRSVFVVGKPGFVHESLLALLQASSLVKVVGSSTGSLSSIDKIAALHASMVITDCTSSTGQCVEDIRLLKQDYPGIKILAIIEVYQRKAGAEWVGVDGLLIKGFNAQELYEAIVTMSAGLMRGTVNIRHE